MHGSLFFQCDSYSKYKRDLKKLEGMDFRELKQEHSKLPFNGVHTDCDTNPCDSFLYIVILRLRQ